MRYVPDWRSRPPLPPSFTERHPWLVPLLLLLACLLDVGCMDQTSYCKGRFMVAATLADSAEIARAPACGQYLGRVQ